MTRLQFAQLTEQMEQARKWINTATQEIVEIRAASIPPTRNVGCVAAVSDNSGAWNHLALPSLLGTVDEVVAVLINKESTMEARNQAAKHLCQVVGIPWSAHLEYMSQWAVVGGKDAPGSSAPVAP